MGRRKKVSAELRKHAGAMLAAVRRVPFWDDEPSAKQQDWWHRLQRGVCDYPGCNGTPCYCDPDCDQEMQRRLHETITQGA